MKKNQYIFNNLLRTYNKCTRRLSSLITANRNVHRQGVLEKHITRLYQKLMNLQKSFQHTTIATTVVLGAMAIMPNKVNAQITFSASVTNPFGLTAIGTSTYATPAFADLDNDGDLDMITGKNNGDFMYNINVGTASAPSYTTAASTNPFGLTNTGNSYASPVFSDIDNDGDMDLLVGQYDGNFTYYQNVGTASAPSFTTSVVNPFGITDAGSYSSPTFTDLDGDGDLDLMVGESYNNDFIYYERTGTASVPVFLAQVVAPFNLIGAGLPTPSFNDLDGDGDKDMISANAFGVGDYGYFENIGTSTVPNFTTVVVNPFSLVATPNGYITMRFVDLNNDGKADLMTGDRNGNYYYNQNITPITTGINKLNSNSHLSVYPNPSTGLFIIETTKVTDVNVIDAIGNVVYNQTLETGKHLINFSGLANGLYILKATSNSNVSTTKLIKD